MNSRKKIFFLVSRFPYPLIKGDKLRAYHQIVELSRTCDIHLCALSDEKVSESAIQALEEYCVSIDVLKLNKFKIFLNLIRYFLFSKKPVQVGYFFHKKIQDQILSRIDNYKPDHIFCQLIRTAEYVRKIKSIPTTLDYMDALSAGMERRSESAAGVRKWIFELEAKRLKKYEHQVFKDFDHCAVISSSDRDLIFHYENEEITTLPNGIDTDFFSPRDSEKKYDLLFTGNMSYPPNVQSALFLANEIMPLIWQKRPETTLLISGANPVPSVKSLASDRIEIRDFVKDIRDSYASSKVFSAPMLIGSGLQNKLLEAMSMKLPCVTSELANKSLGAKEGESIFIGRNPDEYAEQLLFLLENNAKGQEMAEKGHSFVAENFNWKKSNQILLEILNDGRAEKNH